MPHFRSEKMSFYQIILQSDFAFNYISQLGDLGCVQFRETHTGPDSTLHQRKFNGELVLCVEIEKRLRAVRDILMDEKVPLLEVLDGVKVEVPSLKELNEIDTLSIKVLEEIEKVLFSA